jgi:hypothetical protein
MIATKSSLGALVSQMIFTKSRLKSTINHRSLLESSWSPYRISTLEALDHLKSYLLKVTKLYSYIMTRKKSLKLLDGFKNSWNMLRRVLKWTLLKTKLILIFIVWSIREIFNRIIQLIKNKNWKEDTCTQSWKIFQKKYKEEIK